MEDRGSRFFDLAKTAFGILLASIAAAAISHHYKTLETNNALLSEARNSATQTYYDLIDTIGKRHFYAMRAAIGFQYQIEQADRWSQYDKMVINWNERRYSMFALTNRYFGQNAEQEMYVFVKKFGDIHDQLTKAKNLYAAGKPVPDLNSLLDEIYKFDDDISGFSAQLQQQLKTGQVDIYSPQPPLKKP